MKKLMFAIALVLACGPEISFETLPPKWAQCQDPAIADSFVSTCISLNQQSFNNLVQEYCTCVWRFVATRQSCTAIFSEKMIETACVLCSERFGGECKWHAK